MFVLSFDYDKAGIWVCKIFIDFIHCNDFTHSLLPQIFSCSQTFLQYISQNVHVCNKQQWN